MWHHTKDNPPEFKYLLLMHSIVDWIVLGPPLYKYVTFDKALIFSEPIPFLVGILVLPTY